MLIEKHEITDKLEYSATLLNLCAALSGLNRYLYTNFRHSNALEYVTKAIRLLETEEEYKEDFEDPQQEECKNSQSSGTEERKIATLGIAYYNMAVELEYLRKNSDAIKIYEKGMKYIEGKLPIGHVVYQNLLNGLNNTKEKENMLQKYHNDRARNRLMSATKSLFNRYIHENKYNKEKIKKVNITNLPKINHHKAISTTVYSIVI